MCNFFNIILFFRNYFLKMPLPNILEEFIIRKKVCFPNKTDRILQHLKKCKHFQENATPEAQEEISLLLKPNENQVESSQIKCSYNFFIIILVKLIYINIIV